MAEQQAELSGMVTRIDAPHRVKSAGSSVTEGVPADAVVEVASSPDPRQQLQLQAGQLARHLRARQRDIDQREAELNARIAQLENELRVSRLWIQERSLEHTSREQELREQVAELEQQLRGVLSRELAVDEVHQQRLTELRAREDDLAAREKRLLQNQKRVADEAESLQIATGRLQTERHRVERDAVAGRQQVQREREAAAELHRRLLAHVERRQAGLEDQQRQLEQTHAARRHAMQMEGCLRDLDGRQKQIEEMEASVAKQLAELEQERQRLERDRQLAAEQTEEGRRELAEHKRRLEQQAAAASQRMENRHKRIGRRELAAQQLRDESARVHRDTLEMRLIVEELWSQLVERTPSATLTQSVSQLRVRLADQFRLERRELIEKRNEARELVACLDAKRQQLREDRAEFQSWFARRQQAVEEQAARLVARETELAREQQRLNELEQGWASQRHQLQSQVRRLQRSASVPA